MVMFFGMRVDGKCRYNGDYILVFLYFPRTMSLVAHLVYKKWKKRNREKTRKIKNNVECRIDEGREKNWKNKICRTLIKNKEK